MSQRHSHPLQHRADAKKKKDMVGDACSDLWELTNQSRLGLKRQGPKQSVQTEGEQSCCSNGH